MGVIKGVLKEELANSLHMLKRYQEESAKIKGVLVRKKIGQKYYYYLAKRQGEKVKFIYKGPASQAVREAYLKQRKRLEQYKKFIFQVKKQIRFIRKALRGKESV
jgi:hypothetical protein